MHNLKKFCSLALVSSFILVSAHAQTILFNSLGGRPGGSDLIFGAGPIAESFSTGSSSLNLVDVIVNLTDAGSLGSGVTTISLFSNNSGPVGGPFPGTLLTTIGSVDDSQLSTAFQGFNVSLSTPYTLAQNTRYWIELSSSSSSTAQWTYTFNGSGVGVASEFFNNSSGTSPTSSGPYSMEVLASPVPEPSTLVLLGLGAVGLVYTVRRNALAR